MDATAVLRLAELQRREHSTADGTRADGRWLVWSVSTCYYRSISQPSSCIRAVISPAVTSRASCMRLTRITCCTIVAACIIGPSPPRRLNLPPESANRRRVERLQSTDSRAIASHRLSNDRTPPARCTIHMRTRTRTVMAVTRRRISRRPRRPLSTVRIGRVRSSARFNNEIRRR
jgi:hypothetical protein